MTTIGTFSHQLDLEIPAPNSVLIGGEWQSADDVTLQVLDPATEQILAAVARPTTQHADAAVAAARAAFDEGPWPRLAADERIAIVEQFCKAMESRMDDIVRAVTLESGVTIGYSQVLGHGAAVGAWNASIEAARTTAWETDDGQVTLRREPVGTVMAILTYNGPISLIGMKVIPALLAGCPVIVKHAPESQLSGHIIADAAREAGFPPGVISFLPAETDVTQYLVGHLGVDMVAVTGSQPIARDIVQRTSQRLARTALELGGKSPAIITEDADLDAVMATLGDGATAGTGQVCVSLSRILAPRSRYREVRDAFVDFLAARRIGDPLSTETDIGPLSVERARARTENYVQIALKEGATVAYGGKRPEGVDKGFYYEPTLFTDVDNRMRIAQEEVFGPVTVLIPYDGIDDAVSIANDTLYGLAASVYASDVAQAADIARRIRSGTVAINQAGMSLNHAFGGVKQSGWGRECGPDGILEFTDVKQMLLPSGGSFLNA